MRITGRTRLIALLGHPVSHTRSPQMQNPALQRAGMDAVYVPFSVKPENLKEAVKGLRALDFLGANVTLPHKEAVLPLLDELSAESKLIGAVNTIVNRNGRLVGTTTDSPGILLTLKKAGVNPRKRAITLLGTGGSARTALFTFLQQGCRDIALAGRSPEKGGSMVRRAMAHCKIKVPLLKLDSPDFAKRMRETDLLVNCTSVGMWPGIHETPVAKKHLHRRMVIFDIVYNPLKTRLIEGEKIGARTVSGMDMLVFQGMESFRLWTGKQPAFGAFKRSALSS